ncbi:hypothetical protein ABCR94_15995 [Streptomyces sp. 21So2-11]|uniref:hypothetical protein n=1 Tax=Streptomyces sp. 21So2-11 TaxID=3144408 RepID=UPI003219DD99
MKLLLTRESVSMGDDVNAPHERQEEFPDALAIGEVIATVVADGYLPRIAGGCATWVLTTSGTVSLAVVAQQWEKPRLLATGHGPLVSLADPDRGEVRWHFRYFTQEDPDAVYRRLSEPQTPSKP